MHHIVHMHVNWQDEFLEVEVAAGSGKYNFILSDCQVASTEVAPSFPHYQYIKGINFSQTNRVCCTF